MDKYSYTFDSLKKHLSLSDKQAKSICDDSFGHHQAGDYPPTFNGLMTAIYDSLGLAFPVNHFSKDAIIAFHADMQNIKHDFIYGK